MQLGNTDFFNLFARVVSSTNANRDCDEWQVDGVNWRRERHACWAPTSYQMEVHTLVHRTKPAWVFLFVRETWWSINRDKTIRDARWTHVATGSRRDIVRWFQMRQMELDADR